MSNLNNKENTEQLIKEAAKELFFGKGWFKATTQEIADAAKVNRTTINYYFRSRDNLFDIVFQEAMTQMREKRAAIAVSDLPFKEKLGKWLDDELASAIRYPFLEIYIVTELVGKGCHIDKDKELVATVNQVLAKELKKEIEKGTIKPITPIHFILNIASLVSFPMCLRPILQDSLEISNKDFTKILQERKQVILDTIFI